MTSAPQEPQNHSQTQQQKQQSQRQEQQRQRERQRQQQQQSESCTDPLKLLELPPNPTADQIRRAYKKACLRHHPDKHPDGPARAAADRIFKQVGVAYNQLLEEATRTSSSSSPPKKASSTSSAPRPSATASHPTDATAPVDSPLAPDDGFSSRAFLAPEHEIDLPLSLEELALGCVKRHRLRVPGVADALHPNLTVNVKPGYRAGDRIRFRGAWCPPGPVGPADVVFVLSQLPHPAFTLRGDDLHLRMRLALADALTGVLLAVPGLDGQPLNLVLDPVITPDHEQRLVGRGMPCRSDPAVRGDLLVTFDIMFPKRVDAAHRPAVRELFARLDAAATPKRYIRRSSSLFVNLQPQHAASRRSSTALESELSGAARGTAGDLPGKPPRHPRRRFASIFR